MSIVMRSVRRLYEIEDRMILNYSNSLYKRREDIGADRISEHYHILQRISDDVTRYRDGISARKKRFRCC